MKYLIFAILYITTSLVVAQTPDEITPAVEDICMTSGFVGKEYGLCNAYCEAMDCDSESPQASDQACTRVLDKLLPTVPEGNEFRLCDDEDGDTIANGFDNCPQMANPDQADDDMNGVGNVCEASLCPCSDAVVSLGVSWANFSATQGFAPADFAVALDVNNFVMTASEQDPADRFCALRDGTASDVDITGLTVEEYTACRQDVINKLP